MTVFQVVEGLVKELTELIASPATCTEKAVDPSVPEDAEACSAVTDLADAVACEAVMTAAGVAACDYNAGAERFTNMSLPFEFNETCMYLIIVYVLLFLYKKEVMDVVNKVLKKL